MAKYRDHTKAKGKTGCKYIPGEEPKKRHRRRKHYNNDRIDEVRTWCLSHRVIMVVGNEGHHWRMTRRGKRVEYWPSSAKVVIDQKWNRGIHCHGVEQLLRILEREFRKVK